MVNYYSELNLNPSLSAEEMGQALQALRKKLTHRMNAPTLEKRQEAERQLEMLNEAATILTDKKAKAKYDKKIKKSGEAQPRTQTQAGNAYDNSANQSNEMMIAMAEDMYDAGHYKDAISICNRLIENGVNDKRLYFAMGYSYIDMDQVSEGLRVFQNAVASNPNDYDLILYLSRLSAGIGRVDEAEKFINYIQNEVKDHPDYHATLIDIALIRKNFTHADELFANVDESIKSNISFRQIVSSSYSRAANRFLTVAKSGAGYFESEENLKSAQELVIKADNIHSTKDSQSDVEFANDQFKKKFDFKSWKGLATVSFLILAFSEIPSYMFLAILAGAGLIYINIRPKWKLTMRDATGQKQFPDYINWTAAAIFNIFIAIMGFMFALAMRMAFSSRDY